MAKDLDPLDQGLDLLFDQKELSKARARAEDQFRDLSIDQVRVMKRRMKEDLIFLGGALEYDDLSPNFHGHMATWLQQTKDELYRMILAARGHYKTTLVTILDTIQMALPNVSGTTSYPYSLGPNAKILLAHEVKDEAAQFLFEITAAFTRKPALLALFPECIPTRGDQRVNKYELELPREVHHREATISTLGAGGAAQGKHFHWLKLDDIFGEDARDSETVSKRITLWFDNVYSLLTDPRTDGWDLTGTRWSAQDVYGYAQDTYGLNKKRSILRSYSPKQIREIPDGRLVAYVRSAIEQDQIVFPEKFTAEFLADRRKNKIIWASQYANNPLESGLTEFVPAWLRKYNLAANGDIIAFTGDSSFRRRPRDLDIVILCDPSVGEDIEADESGICVTGTDHMKNTFLLETVKRVLSPPELVDELIRLYVKYNPRLLSIEEVAFSAIYKYWIEDKFKELRIHPRIYPYKPPRRKNKRARIRGLSHIFSAGEFYVHETMNEFMNEYEWFPLSKSEHLLDCLAQGPEVWEKGVTTNQIEERRKAEELIVQARDATTGY